MHLIASSEHASVDLVLLFFWLFVFVLFGWLVFLMQDPGHLTCKL